MNAVSLIRISVIDAAIEITRHRTRYPHLDLSTVVRQLRAGPSHLSELDYDSAIILAEQIGWDAFRLNTDRRIELSTILLNIVIRVKPNWAHLSIYGRNRVRKVLDADQEQCLQYAGLLDSPPTERVIQWWDRLASAFRAVKDKRNLETGREGERLTIAYEKKRLVSLGLIDLEPIILAIDDNSAGYDVMSFDKDREGNVYELKIEVKASTSSPVWFVISRNEWDTACKNQSSYLFYIWNLETELVKTFSVEDLLPHMPKDSGVGRWRDAEFTLDALLASLTVSKL